jgi:hypothetical protein
MSGDSLNQLGPSSPLLTGWNFTYGGKDNQGMAESVLQTTDGGYIAAGWTNSSQGAGIYDFWLVKTNATGEMQWNRTYGGASDDEAYSIQQTSDGGYIVAGYTDSFGAGDYDFWLVKTDAAGSQEWNRTYGGASDDEAYSIQQTSDGGYIVAGYTDSFGAGDYDFWLVKTDAAGSQEWNRTYGGALGDYAFSVQRTSDGGYALAGYTNSFGAGSSDFWLVKTNATGGMQWNRTYGGENGDVALSLVHAGSGGYTIAGWTTSHGAGSYDFWLVNTDEQGYALWNRTYGGTNIDIASSLVQTSDGGYALAGYTYSFGAGGSDFWLVKTDASGNVQWRQTYGATLDDRAYSVQQTTDEGFIMAGYMSSLYDMGFIVNSWLVKHPALNTLNDYDGLWHNTDFTITLSPTGNVTAVETYYKINSNSSPKNVSVDGQPKITTEGANNKLEFWSAYSTDNAEPHKILAEIKLDKTPPLGSITISGGAQYTNSAVVTLTLFNVTCISGVKHVRYSNNDVWDQTPWEPFLPNKTWTLTQGDGVKTVYYQIESNAGLNNIFSRTIILDSTPSVILLGNPSDGTNVTTSDLIFNASATDSQSGVTRVDLYLDGQMKGTMNLVGDSTYSLSVTRLTDGNHTWYIKATNGAGHTATSVTRSFTVQIGEGPQQRGLDYMLLLYVVIAFAAILMLASAYYIFRRRKR